MNSVTVIIANPDETHRARCRALLESAAEFEIVAEVQDVETTLSVVKTTPPQVLLLHHRMAGDDLPILVRSVLDRSPLTEILALTEGADEPRILDILAAGGRGYLADADLDTFLAKAVRKVHEGEAWVPRKMVAQILQRIAWLSRTERSGSRGTSSSRYA